MTLKTREAIARQGVTEPRDLSNVHGLTILKKAYIKAYRFSRAIIDNPTVSILIATLTILLITALIALDHQYLYRPELRTDTRS